MSKLKLGVLGAGRGMHLAQTVARTRSAELTALCDADPNRLAQAAGQTGVGKTYNRFEDLLASDVDAVVIATPMPLHVGHTVEALRAGKHVLSEVTAATTIEQCWELVEAVESSDRKYMLAENYCYIGTWTILMGMLRAGLFGELYYAESDQLQEFRGGFTPPGKGADWRTAELAMRRGHQYITHNLGPVYQAMGERVATVACMGSGQHHLPWAKADDTCVVLCQTVSGKLIRIRLDFFSPRPMNFTYYGIQGTKGAYEAPRAPGEPHKVYIEGECEPNTWRDLMAYMDYLPEADRGLFDDPLDGYTSGEAVMIEAFARSVLDDTPTPIDVYDAVTWSSIVPLSTQSVKRNGAPVDIPNFRRD